MISALGCAVDYSLATRMKAKMQAAADAASIASLSQKSPGFLAASVMTGNGTVDNGVTDAKNVFDSNMNGVGGYTNLVRTATVTKTGIKLASSVQFTADVPVVFMKVIGYTKLTVTGISSSAATLPPYLDFYLTLDVSGSMGLPSTDGEQTRLAGINPDNKIQYPTGCTLACHFAPLKSACIDPAPVTPSGKTATQQYPTNNACMGYPYTRVNQVALSNLINAVSTSAVPKLKPGLPNAMLGGLPGSLNTDPTSGLPAVTSCDTAGTNACIQLRLDAVGYAVNQLFITANNSMKVANQFRIGLYPFIEKLYAYFPLTSTINGSSTVPGTINYAAANLATLLDTNTDSNLGSGGTHIDAALNTIKAKIGSTVGDGSTAATPQPYVFLITDGAQDNQTKGVPNGSWAGSNHATVLTDTVNAYPNACKALTDPPSNVIVSVLYIPYQKINNVNTSFAGNEDTYANNNIQYISDSLKACASPGFFYTANSPADITLALNAMFNHALVTAHITN